MAATEEVLRVVVQETMETVHAVPDWLDEALDGFPTADIAGLKRWFTSNPAVKVLRAWPGNAPTAPVVVVAPGESQEGDQVIGSVLSESVVAGPNPPGGGFTESEEGTEFITTHSVLVYVPGNELLCNAISKVLLWVLLVTRHDLEENWGLYETTIAESALALADEWNTTGEAVVFRRGVHLRHKWFMGHVERLYGPFLRRIDVVLHEYFP